MPTKEGKMDKVWLSVTVRISETQYAYKGKRGTGDLDLALPREMLDYLDPGNLFVTLVKAALAEYDASTEEEE